MNQKSITELTLDHIEPDFNHWKYGQVQPWILSYCIIYTLGNIGSPESVEVRKGLYSVRKGFGPLCESEKETV